MKTPYETMFLLPPNVAADKVDEIIERLKKAVEKKYGEILNVDKMGIRRTAYPVNKHRSAFYVLMQYQGNGETIGEMERTLKNADEVLKFLSTKVTTRSSAPLKPAAAAVVVEAAPAPATPAPAASAPATEVPAAPAPVIPAPAAEVPAAQPETRRE